MVTMTQPAPYRWARQDFLRLGALGFFDDANVELIDGEIVTMAPIGPRHAAMMFPIDSLLVVEWAETTLAYDTNRKTDLYASGGIEEYWVIDLAGQAVEVSRAPAPVAPDSPTRRYASWQRLQPGDTIAPLAVPGAVVAIADLLP